MSIIEKYWSNCLFFSDYRSGSFADLKGGDGNSATNCLLNQSGLSLPGETNNALDLDSRITFSDGTFLVKGIHKLVPTFGAEFSYNSSDAGYVFYISPTGQLAIKNDTANVITTATVDLYDKKTTVGFTVSGTAVKFYANGSLLEEKTLTAGTFNIDRLFNGGAAASSYRASGLIESLIILNTAITATEIAQLTSELSQEPDWRVWSKSFSFDETTKIYTPEIYFKGEMHALANERAISSGCLENTPLEIESGSFKIITETVNGAVCKVIECVTAGQLIIPTTSAYGTWRLNFNKATASFFNVFFITNDKSGFSNSWVLSIYNDESIRLLKNGATVVATGASYVNALAWYDLKIIRTITGEFSIYINDVLVTVTTGTNPYTDAANTTSSYLRFDLDAGDKVIYASEDPSRSLYWKV